MRNKKWLFLLICLLGKFTVFESELHDHSQRQENNRLKSPIRTTVQETTYKGLTKGQIRKAVSVLHPNLTIDTKIKNVVQYTRQQTHTQVISISDLQLWCNERLNCPPPDQLHQVFVPFYEVKDFDNIFVLLVSDCMYKVTWNNLLIFGTSDYKHHFHLTGLYLVSSDEVASACKTLFQGVPTVISPTPSTNNGLESLNGKIKQSYTIRNKLSLATFLQTAERMLGDWSTKSAL
ncbi:unnamed protein product [Didymodactylos carnosus]|uniref:Uncharacterized protein n=1 Tax=Didymodactylos carnosus TaxID=1234261 RepID=A0A8S2F5J1_9BILA|nr:unnamed protein product [Didymodactylos carnosus]CAF4196313.1 unnamed protein product [Didymodactylos carnosus]